MNEASLKRDIVRRLLKEGSFARRIEDKWAIGTLDMLIVTPLHTMYVDAKMLGSLATLAASVKQCDQIKIFNDVQNARARAFLVGYRDGYLGFGLPGQRWDAKHMCVWPFEGDLTDQFDLAVMAIFGEVVV
jgi:hypothetical protein